LIPRAQSAAHPLFRAFSELTERGIHAASPFVGHSQQIQSETLERRRVKRHECRAPPRYGNAGKLLFAPRRLPAHSALT